MSITLKNEKINESREWAGKNKAPSYVPQKGNSHHFSQKYLSRPMSAKADFSEHRVEEEKEEYEWKIAHFQKIHSPNSNHFFRRVLCDRSERPFPTNSCKRQAAICPLSKKKGPALADGAPEGLALKVFSFKVFALWEY